MSEAGGLYGMLRDRLMGMTVAELRDLARREGICIGYAPRKADMVREIVTWMRHRDRMDAR